MNIFQNEQCQPQQTLPRAPQQGVAIRQMYYYDFTATEHPLCKFHNKICFTQLN